MHPPRPRNGLRQIRPSRPSRPSRATPPSRPSRPSRSALAALLLGACCGCGTSAALAATVPAPYEVATWRGFRASAVSYTFDDNSPKQFSVAQPMFDSRGLPATFFCIVGNLSASQWSAIKNASAKGHEIGSHTLTHPNLPTLTDAQVTTEVADSKTLIESHTGKKCVSLAYPYCAVPKRSITAQYYPFARSCNGSSVPATPTDFLSIGALGPDVDMDAASESAASSGRWLVWLLHGIDDDPACCPIDSMLLESNLDYVAADPGKWWVETFGNVARYIQERNAAVLSVVSNEATSITLRLTHDLDATVFDYPLTLRRPLPGGWARATITQNGAPVTSQVVNGNLVFDVVPNGGDIVLTQAEALAPANIGANDPHIQYVGRFDMTNPAAPGFDWSYSTIRAKFQGTSCSVKLDGPGKYFDVFIDGVKTDPIISSSHGLQTFPVASGLSDAEHTVTLRRRVEANAGKNIFHGFVLDGGKTLVAPPPAPARRIAFIGDSFTCGYGVEGVFGDPFTNATENAGLTYAAQMAAHYDADCMITAWSGQGMVRNYGDPNPTSQTSFPDHYARTCGSVANDDYAFTWQPHVVVIVLGINDFSTTPHPSREQYVGGYRDFIQTVRNHYPDAHILCTYWSGMNAVASDYVAEAAAASGDSKVHFANVLFNIDFPADYGPDYHPNATGQTKIANAFIPEFDRILGTTWGGVGPGTNPPEATALYAFDGDALDGSGKGNHGTANALTYVSGKVGAQAAQFNGTSSHVSIPRSVTDDFTVAMWVKTTDNAGSAGGAWWTGKGLVDGEVGGGGADWGTALVNGKFVLGVGSGGGDTTLASSVNINDGAWHHLAATRDNTTGAIAVYVDGVPRGTGTGPTGSRTFPSALRIGSLQTGNNFFNGTLDDVRLYPRVLTASEIQALAAGPLAAPQNVTATPGSGTITLAWSAVPHATDYIVRRAPSDDGAFADFATGLTATNYPNTGLSDGATWYYTVTANGLFGPGPASAPVSATTYTTLQNWRLANFETIADAGTAADHADPDGDGWSNFHEYVSGTGPNDASSSLKITRLEPSGAGDGLLIEFPSVAGRSYRVERSLTLEAGSWVTLQDAIVGTGAEIEVADTGAAQPRRFYRVVAW